MPFDPTAITRVYAPSSTTAGLRLRWEASSPLGTFFQVYMAGRLAWSGSARTCVVPTPSASVRIDVGAVLAAERDVDFSASLPASPKNRATLTWKGGRYLGADIAGYHVYQSPTAGAAVDYSKPVATIPVYAGGAPVDGFGFGGFGSGGFGFAPSDYAWTSGPLTSGSWSFGVKSFDVNGNEGPPVTGSASIVAPPLPPARDVDQLRLHYTYDPINFKVTLTWLASPG